METTRRVLEWAHAFVEIFIQSPWLICVAPLALSIPVGIITRFLGMAISEKPKRQESAYVIGDDGELLEVIDDKPKRGDSYDG